MHIQVTIGPEEEYDSESLNFKKAKRVFETQYCAMLLIRSQGQVSKAAKWAGKDRKDFYDLLKRCGIDPNLFRGKELENRTAVHRRAVTNLEGLADEGLNELASP
jgi:hypothetical protein